MGTLKLHSNGSLYSNKAIGTLAVVDGWDVTFGTARKGLGGTAAPRPLLAVPNGIFLQNLFTPLPRLGICNSPPVNGQCTNFILFDVSQSVER